jgi:hypothetical protein
MNEPLGFASWPLLPPRCGQIQLGRHIVNSAHRVQAPAGAAITGFGHPLLAFVPEVPICCRAFQESCSYPAWCHWIGRQNSSHLRLDQTYFQACLVRQRQAPAGLATCWPKREWQALPRFG